MRPRFDSRYIPLLATAFVMIALYAAGCGLYRNFFSLRVAVNLFGDNAFLGIAAIGATLVILSGGIDLSVGSVVAFTSVLIAAMIGKWGFDPLLAMPLTLVIGACFGAAMGCLIQWFELPPFLVTLAGMFLARGLGFVVHPQALGIKHPFFSHLVNESLSVPLNAKVSWPFTAARLMGLPIARTKILLYALSGFCSALAGLVYAFYTQSGNPASCVGLELDAIAAAVIGGTLLSGGAGFMAGTLMGVLILGLIQTLITFQGNLNTWWTRIVVGLLVLLFILLQNLISSVTGRVRSGESVKTLKS